MKIWYFVKLGIASATPMGLVQKVRNSVNMIATNPAFLAPNPLPDPSLGAVTTAIDKLELAEQAYDFNHGKLEKEARDVAFKEAKEIFHLLGGYVQLASGGDKEMILSAGLDVERTPEPSEVPPVPSNVRAEATKVHGQIIVRCGGSKNRRVYKVYRTEGDPSLETGWELIATPVRCAWWWMAWSGSRPTATVWWPKVWPVRASQATPLPQPPRKQHDHKAPTSARHLLRDECRGLCVDSAARDTADIVLYSASPAPWCGAFSLLVLACGST